MSEFLSYKKKRVIVSGCFSGMGEATARLLVELGAEVHGLDFKDCKLPLASFTKIDLRDPRSIDGAVARIGGRVDALFSCAGLPNIFPTIEVMKVNFLGPRKLAEAVLPLMPEGGAIAGIASTAGMGWMGRMPTLMELIATPSYEAGATWCEDHLDLIPESYVFSKEALIVWTMMSGAKFIRRGIRINCILPGPTETPMMPDFEKAAPREVIKAAAQPIDRFATPEEQARPLIFLNSDAASYINGLAMPVDGGFTGGMATGQIQFSAMTAGAAGS